MLSDCSAFVVVPRFCYWLHVGASPPGALQSSRRRVARLRERSAGTLPWARATFCKAGCRIGSSSCSVLLRWKSCFLAGEESSHLRQLGSLVQQPGALRQHVSMSLFSTPAQVSSYEIIESYPHDPSAFTQGLVYAEAPIHSPDEAEWTMLQTSTEVFYESTGLVGESSLRCVHKLSGKVLKCVQVPAPHFAEGLALVPRPTRMLFQLTWLTRTAFLYDGVSLKQVREIPYDLEGWGATYDSNRHCIYTSNGTDRIHIVDADTFEILDQVRVRSSPYKFSRSCPTLWYLNDLEMIPDTDELWCNVFFSDYVAVVDPASWELKRWIDLRGLLLPEHCLPCHEVDVLNGLAWDRNRQLMYVTGKRWPRMYAIRERP
jgi:glutamine cyclotransferase